MKSCSSQVVILFLLFSFLLNTEKIYGQISERVFASDPYIPTEQQGNLYIAFDNLDFFKDNEYTGSFQKGYSLPGFRITAKAIYYPLDYIKLEAGVYALRYWGANRYPNASYIDIPHWKGDQMQRGFHVLPWLRAQVKFSEQFQLVLGNIYGGANHKLIAPLYNEELNLTADPEAGAQILYKSCFVDLDLWLNWESFIFRDDTHQEAFTVGLSTKFKFNDPQSEFHFYAPVQALAQHRGGEIDTIYTGSVNTLMNGAIGFGGTWNTGKRGLSQINIEADLAGYYQQAGKLWPYDNGYGINLSSYADVYNFRFKAAYWWCHDFITMFGNPFYGSISTYDSDLRMNNPSMVYVGAEYSKVFSKGFSMGVDLDLYGHFPMIVKSETGPTLWKSTKMSFSAGVYLRLNPSFLIMKKNNRMKN